MVYRRASSKDTIRSCPPRTHHLITTISCAEIETGPLRAGPGLTDETLIQLMFLITCELDFEASTDAV